MNGKQVTQSGSGMIANLRYRRNWKRLTSVLSIFVVIGTISALMLPAITLNQFICGQDEHIHEADCYTIMTEKRLICSDESLKLHCHTSDCSDGEGGLACNQVDFLVHVHDSKCFLDDGTRICTLKEVKEHRHEDGCYKYSETVVDEGHAHVDECYTWIASETPTCGIEASDMHRHEDVCYADGTELICTEEEDSGHIHTATCYAEDGFVICGLEERAAHTHESGCYMQEGTVKCTVEESAGHQHDKGCYGLVRGELLCTETEREPVIERGEPILTCTKPEAVLHTHKGTCYEYDAQGNPAVVICGKPEVKEHQHTDACFTEQEIRALACEIPEHTHTDECRGDAGLSEDEQAQVDAVILTIDGLPTIEEINGKFTDFDESGDVSGREAYTASLSAQVIPAFAQYDPLTEAQKAAVTNASKLMALKWLVPEEEPELTEEEQAQVDALNAQIEAMVDAEALSAELSLLSNERNLAGWNAAVKSASEKAQVARTLYDALSDRQKKSVVGIQKLDDLEGMLAEINAPTLTEEEKAPVDEVIAQIEALPALEELTAQPDEILRELLAQSAQIRDAYKALNSVQQAAVENEPKLAVLEEYLSALDLGPTEEDLLEAEAVCSEISMLPDAEALQDRFDAMASDPEGLAAYQAKLVSQVKGLMARYELLHEEAKATVTNIQDLLDLIVWLEEIGLVEPEPDYWVSSGDVSAEVLVDGTQMPEGAQFVLDSAAFGPEETDMLLKQLNDHLLQQDQGVLSYVAMDMHFADAEGTEIPFGGSAAVTLTFDEPILPGARNVQVFHFSGETVENVTGNITRTEAGISSVTLKTNGFSPVVVADIGGHIEERLDGDYAYIYDAVMKPDDKTISGQAISTGTASWDNDDNPGNDTSATNSILRTFDVATYTLRYKTGLRKDATDQGISGYRTGTVYFEFILPLSVEEGQFEPGSMGWLATYTNVKYEIAKEANRQILRGSFLAEPVSGNPVAIGNSISELNVAIRVLRMKQGDEVQPTFTLWLEGNNVDAGVVDSIPTKTVTGTTGSCEAHGEQEFKTITPAKITISAIQRLNLAMIKGEASFTSLVDDFSFGTGNELAMNKAAGNLNGRIFVYGLTLQVVGKDATSGLKGIELPDDDVTITFDLKMTSSWRPYTTQNTTTLDTTEYRSMVWSASPSSKGEEQQDGRVITAAHDFPATAAPFNSGAPNGRKGSCFNGGSWSFSQDANDKQLYHVTVKDFVIDISDIKNFPSCTGEYAGSAAQGQYYNPTLDTMQNAWNIQTACFSAGELWVVQPLVVNSKTLPQKYNGDGDLRYEIQDSNFKVNGKSVTQANTQDDHDSYAVGLELPGSIESDIYYTTYNGGWNKPLTAGQFETGYDWATSGQPLTIFHLISNDNAEGDNRGCAMELFTKFDENFFDPDGTYSVNILSPSAEADANGVKKWWSGEPPEIKVLWVSRVFGRGWDNGGLKPDKSNSLGTGNNVKNDNYDWDMISAFSDGMSNGEQFQFFESLEELEATTYVDSNGNTQHEQCIGVLVEIRGIVAQGMNHVELKLNGKVREDCAPGYVYMTVTHSRLWRIKDVEGTARAWFKLTADDNLWMSQKLERIDQYVREIMPSHLYYRDFEDTSTKPTKGFNGQSIKNTQYSVYQMGMFKQIYWDKRIGGKTPNKNGNEKGHPTGLKNMQKIWYKNGTSGGDSNQYRADTCLVVGHSVSIKKSTAQKTVDQSGMTNSKKVYSLNLGECVVDFMLTPSVKRTLGKGDAGAGNQTKTTITIKDTLPKELEYIDGSAYWGGSYTQNPKCAHPGTITGGTKLDPVVTKNSDGSTTLTWTLKDVVLTKLDTMELSPIYFSTRLTGVLEDQQGIKNTATIQSTGDNLRLLTEANNNKAVFGITLQKSKGASLVKLADQERVELDTPMGFTMFVGNNSADDMQNQIIVDDLPWNGDGRGTSFTGAMNVTEFSVNQEFASKLTYYYTINTAYRGKKSTDYTSSSFTAANGWAKVTPGTAVNGMSPLSVPKNVVQVVAVGTLPAGRTLQMHTTIQFPGSSGGNKVVNQLTMDSLNSRASSRVVSRSLSGLTWIDANHNGLQDNGEKVQSGVKVTLMKLDENGAYQDVVSVQTGQQYDVARGKEAADYEEGKYLFYNLLPGTYAVRFEKGDFDITYYHPSPVDTGENLDNYDRIDSDGVPTLGSGSELLQTSIEGVYLPEIEEMVNGDTYHSPYHDSGFYAWGVELPATGAAGTEAYMFSGLAVMVAACSLMYKQKRKPRKTNY